MVTACKIDLEMKNLGATVQRHGIDIINIFFSGFNHTKPRNHQTAAHKSKNKSNSRIKKTEAFLNLLNTIN
jgi:hypothetical protein